MLGNLLKFLNLFFFKEYSRQVMKSLMLRHVVSKPLIYCSLKKALYINDLNNGFNIIFIAFLFPFQNLKNPNY